MAVPEEGRADLNLRFGKRLAELRKRKKWTFIQFAGRCGLDPTFLHALEHGNKEPCLGTIEVLAECFEPGV